MEYNIKDFMIFKEAFESGYNYVMASRDKTVIEKQQKGLKENLDYNNMKQVGYSYGIDYALYCVDTFQTQIIKPENFVAVVDKYHTQAMNKREENKVKEMSIK